MLRFGNLTDEELTKLKEMLAASKAKPMSTGKTVQRLCLSRTT